MRTFKNSFAWQFAGGFLLGAVGLLAFQPASATHRFEHRLHRAAAHLAK